MTLTGGAEETLLLVSLYFFGKIGRAKAPSLPSLPPPAVPVPFLYHFTHTEPKIYLGIYVQYFQLLSFKEICQFCFHSAYLNATKRKEFWSKFL